MTSFLGYRHFVRPEFWKSGLKVRFNSTLTLAAFILISLCLKLYVTNIIQYHSLYPDCPQVYDEKSCNVKYGQGAARAVLKEKMVDEPRMPIYEFIPTYLYEAESSLYGLVGHKRVYMEGFWIMLSHRIFMILGLASIIFLLYRNPNLLIKNRVWLLSGGVFLFYSAIVTAQNYLSYIDIGKFGVALQGRYHLPGLLAFGYFLIFPIYQIKWGKMRWPIFALLIISMSFGGAAFMRNNAPHKWTKGLNLEQ